MKATSKALAKLRTMDDEQLMDMVGLLTRGQITESIRNLVVLEFGDYTQFHVCLLAIQHHIMFVLAERLASTIGSLEYTRFLEESLA